MKRLLFLLLSLSLFASIRAPEARADDAKLARTVFALIVTSNHGASGTTPDLHYADDDGVKYLELFRMLAPEANVLLHTELDRDTERLYPWARAVARPPTRAAVSASIADLASRVGAVTRAGGAAELYFVFAGHGDVDAGVGFLELQDARFTSQDLEAMLRTIAATQSHVILDSCNSFFVISARKPGGRPVATTADLARSLSERWPNVGVFLSTSSEAEVFEWSELQAGIFSHAVRSGLSGAADANGDGVVSYEELRTFVSVASTQIKNPLYRPKVFARGPGANPAAPLVSLAGAHGTALRIDGPEIRLTLRDADEIPLVDLHKEDGAVVTVRLPDRWAAHAAVEQRDASARAQVLRRFSLEAAHPAEKPIALAELTPAAPLGETRGASDVFRMLFAVPFGPRAMAQAVEEVRREDATAVYGVSEDEVQRLRILLAQVAGDAQGKRITLGTAYVSFGAVAAGSGGWLLSKGDGFGYAALAEGGLFAGVGGLSLLRRTGAESLYRDYAAAIESSDPSRRAAAVASAECRLFGLRREAHAERIRWRVSSFILAGAAAAMFAVNEIAGASTFCSGSSGSFSSNLTCAPSESSDSLWAGRIVSGSIFALGATLAVSSFVPESVERLADIWQSDPGRVREGTQGLKPRVSFAPAPGGGQLQLGVSF
jgi:uncharacterized caspase-like protein